MPNALAIGVPYELFWHLSPRKLNAFYKADEIILKRKDAEMWHLGQYILSAVSVATDHCLNGKKAQSKYIEQPLMRIKASQEQLSEDELKVQREIFVAMLMAKKTNFELNNKKEKGSKC